MNKTPMCLQSLTIVLFTMIATNNFGMNNTKFVETIRKSVENTQNAYKQEVDNNGNYKIPCSPARHRADMTQAIENFIKVFKIDSTTLEKINTLEKLENTNKELSGNIEKLSAENLDLKKERNNLMETNNLLSSEKLAFHAQIKSLSSDNTNLVKQKNELTTANKTLFDANKDLSVNIKKVSENNNNLTIEINQENDNNEKLVEILKTTKKTMKTNKAFINKSIENLKKPRIFTKLLAESSSYIGCLLIGLGIKNIPQKDGSTGSVLAAGGLGLLGTGVIYLGRRAANQIKSYETNLSFLRGRQTEFIFLTNLIDTKTLDE